MASEGTPEWRQKWQEMQTCRTTVPTAETVMRTVTKTRRPIRRPTKRLTRQPQAWDRTSPDRTAPVLTFPDKRLFEPDTQNCIRCKE